MRNAALAFPLLLVLAACSGNTSSLGTSPTGPTDAGAHDVVTAHPADTGVSPSSAQVYVRLNAVQTPTGPVAPGAPQETPTDQRAGILGLTLLRDASDPSPLVVLDLPAAIDTLYNDGASTLIGAAPASAVTAGTYTLARVPVSYVNFTVAGVYHAGATPEAGDFTDLISLGTAVTLNGATRDRGWWASSFAVLGVTEGQTSGENAAIAQPASTSGMQLDLSGPVAAYVFPVNLVIPAAIPSDLEIIFTVNTFEDFHWTDQAAVGNTPGVFDVSSSGFEPVTQLGANSFTVTIVPVVVP